MKISSLLGCSKYCLLKIDWEERMLNVLLLKRSISPQKNKWSLPGGFVQGDETLEEAARRIFVVETGISLHI